MSDVYVLINLLVSVCLGLLGEMGAVSKRPSLFFITRRGAANHSIQDNSIWGKGEYRSHFSSQSQVSSVSAQGFKMPSDDHFIEMKYYSIH
jgi:hypothetical protein